MCTLMARGAYLSQQCMWKKLAKEPQGAPSIEPSKYLFIKANVSSPLGT